MGITPTVYTTIAVRSGRPKSNAPPAPSAGDMSSAAENAPAQSTNTLTKVMTSERGIVSPRVAPSAINVMMMPLVPMASSSGAHTVGVADQPVLWAPQPGRHDLVLVDAGGEELDRIRFEVRGAARTQ